MNVSEVQLSYKSNVKSSTRYKINSSQDAYELLIKCFPDDTIEYKESFKVVQFGNVKTVTAYLYGLCVEDMKEEDFAEQDLQYPFIICAKISKE